MGHATDGTLRRLVDEPFAITDATVAHVEQCRRCGSRAALIAEEAGWVGRRLTGPQLLPDVDEAWADLQERLVRRDRRAATRLVARRAPATRRVLARSARGGAVAAAAATLALTGTAAAVALSGVFAPTRVAPVSVDRADLKAVGSLLDLSGISNPDGFPTPSGSGALAFGRLTWSSAGAARTYGSVGAAAAVTGVVVRVPGQLPAGVGRPTTIESQPRVTATICFDRAAGSLAGTSVVLHAGPAVVVGYGSRGTGLGVPTMVVATMPRPTADATGATISQIESFLLSRPGVPTQLAPELRLLGDLSTVLPFPAPSGLQTSSVHVGRWPGVAIALPSGVAAAVVWEDGTGTVRAVGGLLDRRTLLRVADQLR